jgi:hypothetical protein
LPPAPFVPPKPAGPRPKPKPAEQLPSTFASIAMLLAVTAPVSSVFPMAVTHSPTASAVEVAVTVFEYFVDGVVVTVMLVTVGEADADGEALEPKARRRLSTTKLLPSTFVINPSAPKAPRLKPLAPGERVPLGRGAGVPLSNRPAKPFAPPPKPPVQEPLTGSLSTTAAAATVALDDDAAAEVFEPVAGRATAHIPTCTSAAVAATVFVM